ncbi:unnamed protein product [marine sediment metagenome]|uniref:PEGA domain-containing protein n=1 Tax=marine sediment metagenome TaxID=412755 RepID=X1CGU6_9ZZZZ
MVRGNTDENGIAVFTVEEGTYLVTAGKSGYATQIVEVIVNQDATLEITLQPVALEGIVLTGAFVGVGLIMFALI